MSWPQSCRIAQSDSSYLLQGTGQLNWTDILGYISSMQADAEGGLVVTASMPGYFSEHRSQVLLCIKYGEIEIWYVYRRLHGSSCSGQSRQNSVLYVWIVSSLDIEWDFSISHFLPTFSTYSPASAMKYLIPSRRRVPIAYFIRHRPKHISIIYLKYRQLRFLHEHLSFVVAGRSSDHLLPSLLVNEIARFFPNKYLTLLKRFDARSNEGWLWRSRAIQRQYLAF